MNFKDYANKCFFKNQIFLNSDSKRRRARMMAEEKRIYLSSSKTVTLIR